jgi:hypothetical protein
MTPPKNRRTPPVEGKVWVPTTVVAGTALSSRAGSVLGEASALSTQVRTGGSCGQWGESARITFSAARVSVADLGS